jgi:2-dehydro-3-deoxyphosphogluconate aldolase / (4S)-4-hydroxy-2-oxoglutarate aldolase
MEPVAFTRLREQRLVAVIRAPDARAALGAARAVAAGGVRIVEITFTVPGAVRVMAALKDEPALTDGAGTVLSAEQAREALAAGARFLIAPNLSREVAHEAAGAGVLFCPGAYTATEILAARDAGAQVVKVYPVGIAGGPDYIRIIRDPLPDVPLLAAGGTTLENVVPFLEAGCVGVGLGAALADPALAAAGHFDALPRRARACVERLEAAGLRAAGA